MLFNIVLQACLAPQLPAVQEMPFQWSSVILWPIPSLITINVIVPIWRRLRSVTLYLIVNHVKQIHATCSRPHRSSPGVFCNRYTQQWVKSRRFDQDRLWLDCGDRQELPLGQADHTREKSRHHIKKMLSESTTEVQKGKREIWEGDWTAFRSFPFEEVFSQDSLRTKLDMLTLPLTQTYI